MGLIKNFNEWSRLNESESLDSLNIPDRLLKLITGDSTSGPSTSDSSDRTSRTTFHTNREPHIAKGGHWPEKGGSGSLGPNAHITNTVNGQEAIYNHLMSGDLTTDTDVRFLIANPDTDNFIYLTRRTGKMSMEQLKQKYGDNLSGTELMARARKDGSSQKRGIYFRASIMDKDSNQLVSSWEGTAGQIASELDDNSILYVLEG